jgi:hypothetical protein
MAPSSGFVPQRRRSGLIMEQLDGEVLLYVEPAHRAFCLNQTAARVWEAIDGRRDLGAIAERVSLEPEIVAGALRDLGESGLLEAVADLPSVDLSRRRLMRAGLIAIPFIVAITVPRAAEAASCTVGLPSGPACSPTVHCCTGICNESTGICG